MTTIVLLVAVSALIAGFSYFTNAGFGDRKPRDLRERDKRERQASAGPAEDEEPPPHK